MNKWVEVGLWVFMFGFLFGKVSPKIGEVIAVIGAIVVVLAGAMDIVLMVQR
jgi:hypothetical protein